MCTLCKIHKETTNHFFFECSVTQQLLNYIPEIVVKHSNSHNVPHFTLENVLFNTCTPNQKELCNFIVLALKNYLYINRCMKKKVTREGFEHYIDFCRKCEYYNAKQQGKCHLYYTKWYNKDHVENGKIEDCTQPYQLECILYDRT